VAVRGRSVGIGAGIGEIITDTDTKPIPAVSADTRYRYRSQPSMNSQSAVSVPMDNGVVFGQDAYTDLDFADDISLLAELLSLLIPK